MSLITCKAHRWLANPVTAPKSVRLKEAPRGAWGARLEEVMKKKWVSLPHSLARAEDYQHEQQEPGSPT
ncbi:unnamed protein product [Linum trigynum]|uniref:Uncharacterized protein n=1 Tax=Linum trigynum TaxID=586398 RepID=A0AAV2DAN8_9ROSI